MLYNEFAAAVKRIPNAEKWVDKLSLDYALSRADTLSIAYQAAEAVYMCPWFDGVLGNYAPARQAELNGDGCAGRHFILVREILASETGMTLFRFKFAQFLHLHLHSLAERAVAKANTYRDFGAPTLEIVTRSER